MRVRRHTIPVISIALIGYCLVVTVLYLRERHLSGAMLQSINVASAKTDATASRGSTYGNDNVETVELDTSADGTWHATYEINHALDKLTLRLSANPASGMQQNGNSTVELETPVPLWEGSIPRTDASWPSAASIYEFTSAIAFSADTNAIAFKAPDDTVHIWRVDQTDRRTSTELSAMRTVRVKRVTPVKTIRLQGVMPVDGQHLSPNTRLLFSGDSRELYAQTKLQDGSTRMTRLYPAETDIDPASYGAATIGELFPVPGKPGFGYVAYEDTEPNTFRLVHWISETVRVPLTPAMSGQGSAVVLSPGATKVCLASYERKGDRDTTGAPVSVLVQRIYGVRTGNVITELYPSFACVRWIDEETVVVGTGTAYPAYYSLQAESGTLQYLIHERIDARGR